MSSLGHPVRIEFLSSLAFSVARRRSSVMTDNPIKPRKNWPWPFEKRPPELKARRVKTIIRLEASQEHIYNKITEWFKVISKVLKDLDTPARNVYNIDKTVVLLSKLSSVKVLVGKDDLRDYRGASVKRTIVTAIKCISGNGRSMLPLMI
ncbi:hypothetical protein BCR34DRAFT_574399 [Clohesyomyces aquaticus]|uniref:Uncharacterized protein n=1 Tax=Clohesyomyces aquaticus TaxID=1231657 RepID=A0A1Y1YVW0_9PLEO|nr:hypothetical protein BCR34DRAFT_574399 [Clohesyomyces aquaticus]